MADAPEVRDLLVTPLFEGDDAGALDLVTAPPAPGPGDLVDLATVVGADVLRQGLVLRLLTPLGSMAPLGHVGFGSRLHELVGELDSPTLRLLARAHALRAVLADPRVEAVLALEVLGAAAASRDRLELRVLVRARDLTDPVALGIEVAL